MDELELCAREASTESSAYLDTETGEVLVVVKGEPDEKMLRQRVRAERKRYPVVPAFGLSEERALLRDFLSRATQGSGRELLVRLVDEPGAFHACLTALKADAALWREWEKFEITGLRGKLLGWMAEHGVQPRFMISATADD